MWRIGIIIAGLSFIYYLLFVNDAGKGLRPQLMQEVPRISRRVQEKVQSLPAYQTPIPTPTPHPLTAEGFFDAINTARRQTKLPMLQSNQSLCSLTDVLLKGKPLKNSLIEQTCSLCSGVLSMVFDVHTSSESAIEQIRSSSASAIINSSEFRQACAVDNDSQMAIVAAKLRKPAPTPQPIREINEDELWQALLTYREAQRRTNLEREEKLCVYARKRVDDHLRLLAAHTSKDAYPIPDKYPLDAHEGFKKDADSGYVFEVTGRQVIAENLAYWPNALYATHVIEWGWDTSTEGHRETQVSNDFTVGCLTGKQGFFVAIFGK